MGKARSKSRKIQTPYAKPARKQYFGCIYRYRLTGVPPGHFLHNTPYFGQTLRWVTSHQAALDQRHSEHVRAATTQTATTDDGMQALGLHEAMRQYGVEAFELTMLGTFPPFRDRTAAPTTWQPWADEEEVRLIDENGGVMRYFADEDDDHGGCQTFNLTPGGQANAGGAQKRWEALWARSQQAWLTFQSELLKYAEANDGDMKVPQTYTADSEYPLGRNVACVRNNDCYLKGYPERWEWLDSQPGGVWGVRDSSWEEFKLELLEYEADKEHGDMKVPQRYTTASGYPLGRNVSCVRSQHLYLNGYPERWEWLDSQPGWAWSVPDSSWEEFKLELLKYEADKEHGDMKVPSKYTTASGYPLGQTVNNVRNPQQQHYVKGHPERWEWLDSQPGWAWNVRDDSDLQAWLTFKSELLKYEADKEHGHMKVPSKYETARGYPLGRMVNKVRGGQHLNGHPERIRWLLDQPGWKWLVGYSRTGGTNATRRAHWEQVWREQKRTACTSRDSNPRPKTGA